MKALLSRSVAVLPRLLAAPVAALALAVGIGAAAPAANAGITPDCAWQSLYLLHGWQSSQNAWNTGDPAYCIDNGVVYLSGSLNQPTSGGLEFAVLPPQALPTSTLYPTVYTNNGAAGSVTIESDGSMYAWGGDDAGFTSLAGISFPLTGSALQSLPLYPGWQSANSLWASGDPSYLVSNGIVHLAGSATTSNPGNWFADIPPGILPDHCIETNVYTYQGTVGSLFVDPSNAMWIDFTASANAQFTSLADVAYPASGAAWLPLTLQDGWTPAQAECQNGAPSYYLSKGIVYLSGALAQTQPGSGAVGTLPLAARPAHDLYLTVSAGQKPYADLLIRANGQMFVFGGASQPSVTSLSGISYQVSA